MSSIIEYKILNKIVHFSICYTVFDIGKSNKGLTFNRHNHFINNDLETPY